MMKGNGQIGELRRGIDRWMGETIYKDQETSFSSREKKQVRNMQYRLRSSCVDGCVSEMFLSGSMLETDVRNVADDIAAEFPAINGGRHRCVEIKLCIRAIRVVTSPRCSPAGPSSMGEWTLAGRRCARTPGPAPRTYMNLARSTGARCTQSAWTPSTRGGSCPPTPWT